MKLLRADFDPKRGSVSLAIDLEVSDDVPALEMTYSTDPRKDGETVAQYRSRVQDWLVGVRREARLLADETRTRYVPDTTIEDVSEQVRAEIER